MHHKLASKRSLSFVFFVFVFIYGDNYSSIVIFSYLLYCIRGCLSFIRIYWNWEIMQFQTVTRPIISFLSITQETAFLEICRTMANNLINRINIGPCVGTVEHWQILSRQNTHFWTQHSYICKTLSIKKKTFSICSKVK